MKFSCILILPFLIIYASSQSAAVPGTVEQSCNNQTTTCDESSQGCGLAGSSNNWLYDSANAKCIVVDCNQLTNNGAMVSSFACASCFTSGTSSAGMNAGNIYANTNGDACVSIDCINLALQQQMTTASCIICVGNGSTVNSDNATCTNSTSSSLIVITSILLFLSLLV